MTNTSQLFKDDEQEKTGSASDDELRKITGINPDEESAMEQGASVGAQEDQAASAGGSSGSGGSLKEREQAGGAADTDKPDAAGGEADPRSKQSFLKNGTLKGGDTEKILGIKKSRMLYFGAGGGMATITLIIMLLIIASSLKIPNLTQNIAALEFTRVTRQMSESASRVTGESLAEKALSAKDKNIYQQKYADAKGKASEAWSKLDKYRPEKTIQNMGKTNGLKLTFDSKGQFIGGTLNGEKFTVNSIGKARFVPGLGKLLKFNSNVSFARSFTPALNDALRTNEIGPVIRGAVDNNIRQKLGISLVAWNLGKFQGKGDQAALIEETKQKASRINNRLVPDESTTSNLKDAEEKTRAASAEALTNDTIVKETIDNGGVVKKAAAAMEQALAESGFKNALGVINPVYAVAMPMCIVYDGSLEKSGPKIDNNIQQQQATFFYVAAGGDQQGFGTPINDQSTSLTAAVGALNSDLGDTTQSNAYVQMSGGTVNTSNMPSAEASAGGEFTLLNATPGLSPTIANTINGVADNVCPVLTNTAGAIALGVVNLAAAFASLGTSTAAEGAAEAGAQVVVKEVSANLAERIVTRVITKATTEQTANNLSRAGKLLYGFGKDSVRNAFAVAGTTVLAKLIVSNRAGEMNSGFSQGTNLADQAQAGANIHANEIQRVQLFGAPLLEADQVQSDHLDAQVIAAADSNKSLIDRYVSVKNPQSLIARMAIALSGQRHVQSFGSIIKLGASILRPETFGSLLRPLIFGKAQAAANNTHYGNVQFGWTGAENTKIKSDDSYYMVENQSVLDDSGKEAEIAQKFARCFGYTSDSQGVLTLAIGSGEQGSLGTLLSEGTIMRDENGNIINTSKSDDCSPRNLSFNNPQYGDLVFRWRLAQMYNTTADQLIDEQDVQT